MRHGVFFNFKLEHTVKKLFSFIAQHLGGRLGARRNIAVSVHMRVLLLSAVINTVLCLAVHSQPLTIASAASNRYVMDELVQRFKQKNPLVEINVVYGASGRLATQIKYGAPFDVFYSANVGFAQALFEQGLTVSQPKDYALGLLALYTYTSHTIQHPFEFLKSSKIKRIGLANPKHAPYGIAAKQVLQYANIWDALQPKIIYGDSVAHAKYFTYSGNAQASIIALSLLYQDDTAKNVLSGLSGTNNLRNKSKRVVLLPEASYSPLYSAAVVIKKSKQRAIAEKFLAYSLSNKGQEIFSRYGFKAVIPPLSSPN